MHTHPAYEYLFNQDLTASNLRDVATEHVFRYRTKTIKSGPELLECEVFPIWNTRSEMQKARAAVTREAQRQVNERNAGKKLDRLVNTNFTGKDLFLTLSYGEDPPNAEQALKDIQNYIRRVKAWRKREGIKTELKYIYVIEWEDEPGEKPIRIHQHLFISGGMDRDKLEEIWTRGRANSRRLQPDDFGLSDIARYVIKNPKTAKRWYSSRNLTQPRITNSDTKLSRRKAMRIAEDFNDSAAAILYKAYPGYSLVDIRIRSSEFVSGMYIYARMIKAPAGWWERRKQQAEAQEDSLQLEFNFEWG